MQDPESFGQSVFDNVVIEFHALRKQAWRERHYGSKKVEPKRKADRPFKGSKAAKKANRRKR